MAKRLTTKELADLFLTRLHDFAEQNGYHRYADLDKIAAEFGETDGSKVMRIARHLEDQGLINAVISTGGSGAILTAAGALYVEEGGETGVISEYRSDPASFVVIDNSTTIHGAVTNSNLAVHSSRVSQRIQLDAGVEGKLVELIETIRRDASLAEEAREDALAEVEILRLELGKSKKDEGRIRGAFETLGQITSVGMKMLELGKVIFGMS